jgi:hypothetical protein
MDLSRMCLGIMKIIDEKYTSYQDCYDIIQIKNLCHLYQTKQKQNLHSISLKDINITSPYFRNIKYNTRQIDILRSDEFFKKYVFFIKIIYSCLKLDINLFDVNDNIATFKNNYHLIKTLLIYKKKLINENIKLLKSYYGYCHEKEVNYNNDERLIEYENFVTNFIIKIKIINKLVNYMKKLIQDNIFTKNDNLFSIILPYFYQHTEYIEEYNNRF